MFSYLRFIMFFSKSLNALSLFLAAVLKILHGHKKFSWAKILSTCCLLTITVLSDMAFSIFDGRTNLTAEVKNEVFPMGSTWTCFSGLKFENFQNVISFHIRKTAKYTNSQKRPLLLTEFWVS